MLSRKYRIHKSLFPAVTRGKVVQNDIVRVVIKQDSVLTHPKFAVIVANKVAKRSVTRNLLRRQAYSILETIVTGAPNAFISVFIKKSDVSFELIQNSINELLCLKK